MTDSLRASLLGLALLMLPFSASAQGSPEGLPHPGKFELLVCYPGGPAKLGAAQKAVNALLTVLVRLGGLPAQPVPTAHFVTDPSDCRRVLAGRPKWTILSLALYLEHAESNQLLPVARPKIDGGETETWSLVVKQGRAADLAALKGGKLGGTAVDEPELVRRLLLTAKNTGGQVTHAGEHFRFVPGPRPLSQLRQLVDGELDAMLLTGAQHRSLAALPFAEKLQTLWTSPALPLVGVLADGGGTTPAERAAMQKALAGVCADTEGAKLCAVFGMQGFESATAADYQAAAEAWAQAPAAAR